MSDVPRFGQHAPQSSARPNCPKHPGQPAVSYCKRCNRPTCAQCTIPTEVGSICPECAKPARRGRVPAALQATGAPATLWLIGICVAVYLVKLVWPQIDNYIAFNPVVAAVEPWRFFTAAFAHSGFTHLLFNMIMLFLIGSAVERASGHWRFLSLYFLSALGGSLAIVAWTLVEPSSLMTWTVGASGAIYGLFGAVFVEQRRSGMSTVSIVVLLVINLAFSFTNPGVSWQAHVGGLVVGGLMAWIYLVIGEPRRGTSGRKQNRLAIWATIGAAVVLFGLYYGVYAIHPQLVF